MVARDPVGVVDCRGLVLLLESVWTSLYLPAGTLCEILTAVDTDRGVTLVTRVL